jgi:hypothetical protein
MSWTAKSTELLLQTDDPGSIYAPLGSIFLRLTRNRPPIKKPIV